MPANIPAVSTTGVWYRHVRAGAPPMPGHPAPDGRWQRGEQLAALYVAQDPDTVWAEWYRALAELGEPPDLRLPRDLWRFSLNLPPVADLSTKAARRLLGLPRIRQTSLQWPSFQAVGEQLAAEGAQGILYSSAARTRSLCLCVFDGGLAGLRIEREPVRVLAPPQPRGLRT